MISLLINNKIKSNIGHDFWTFYVQQNFFGHLGIDLKKELMFDTLHFSYFCGLPCFIQIQQTDFCIPSLQTNGQSYSLSQNHFIGKKGPSGGLKMIHQTKLGQEKKGAQDFMKSSRCEMKRKIGAQNFTARNSKGNPKEAKAN